MRSKLIMQYSISKETQAPRLEHADRKKAAHWNCAKRAWCDHGPNIKRRWAEKKSRLVCISKVKYVHLL
jgi:hypothetical protein